MAIRLVADVGGTNTRLGLAENATLRGDTVQSFRNDDYPGFLAVTDVYLSQLGDVTIEQVVAAIAGPVSGQDARLTNRDWSFVSRDIAQRFGGVPVALLNDLKALGYAIPRLEAENLNPILETGRAPGEDGQSLVIGVGTGCNVSPVILRDGAVVCTDAEFGHVHLPQDLHARLQARLGSVAQDIQVVEDCFSGRGFHHLRMALCGADPDEANLEDFANFYAELLALLTGNLAFTFLPTAGIYFAGGVARNLLATPARNRFVQVFERESLRRFDFSAPIWSILDDAAALKGCSTFPIAS